MATGRIGSTPTLRTRWSKLPTTGTTVLSGLDDNSVALVYDAGYEAVYRNGVLLSRGNDYTATNGTTVTLIDATLATDIIEIFANDLVPLTDAISKGQYNAKGALLSATAASTPAVLAVGTNDQVLTADSTTSTGLKWAAPAAGGMTVIASGTLSGSTLSLTSIPATYNQLIFQVNRLDLSTNDERVSFQFNSDTGNNYFYWASGSSTNTGGSDSLQFVRSTSNTVTTLGGTINITNYAVTNTIKLGSILSVAADKTTTSTLLNYSGFFTYQNTAAAISSMQVYPSAGTFDGGTYTLWGVK
jgi:hypothetical protein